MNKDREGIVWGLMTDEETSELQFVERDGKSVEEYDGVSWRKMTDTRFLRHKAYRINPAKNESEKGKCKTCKNNPSDLCEECSGDNSKWEASQDDKPELMICREMIYGESGLAFHVVPHEEGTDCARFKCVPCAPEKAVELPEEIDENKVVFMPEVVEKYNKLIKYLKAKEGK